MTGIEVLWFLLPFAAGSGWLAGRRQRAARREAAARRDPRKDYVKGIGYILNEQPDKAIESFVQALEVDSETVETHLALGNLYRRRGEVDRAIRIHQNLIARNTLEPSDRSEALLELAQDYQSAGLLDRAEDLYRELADHAEYRVQALRQLIDIYEQEKDWEQAVVRARKLEAATGNQLGHVIAHYQCEQAAQHLEAGDQPGALGLLRRALDVHRGCVRASIIEGDILFDMGRHEPALKAYQRVESQDPEYIPEVIDRLRRCYEALAAPDAFAAYLTHVMERYHTVAAVVTLAGHIRDDEGPEAAVDFLAGQLRRRASLRGLQRLVSLELDVVGRGGRATRREYLELLEGLVDELLENRPAHRCQHCGFTARAMHWQCPGCKHWSSIRPIQGVDGE